MIPQTVTEEWENSKANRGEGMRQEKRAAQLIFRRCGHVMRMDEGTVHIPA